MTVARFIPQCNPGASYAAHRGEIDAAVARVLRSGRYVLGDEVAAFEAEFAAFLGIGQAIGVASGTDALELALRACDIGLGDAVLAPSHTAVATIAAIQRTGAQPIFVDVADPVTYTISGEEIEAALAHQTGWNGARPAAVIAVQLYGNVAEMPAILDVARKHRLTVIEDCAQAHGARLHEQRAGTFGDLAAFSFYPTKNLAAVGDGGLVATNDEKLASRVRALRQYGWDEQRISQMPGVNSRLDEMQAAILRTRLPHLDAENERRREIARRYHTGLARLGIRVPLFKAGVEHVFHQYVIRTLGRDELRSFLEREGIGTAIHYPTPVHLQPAYRERALKTGELRLTEHLCEEILSLPMFPQLSDADVDRVIGAVGQWCGTRSVEELRSATPACSAKQPRSAKESRSASFARSPKRSRSGKRKGRPS